MKILLLFFALSITCQGYAASLPSGIRANSAISDIPAGVSSFDDNKPGNHHHLLFMHLPNPFKERELKWTGKGTMGLILGITLGPVGWLGVHLFSHNGVQRDKAKIGFGIWLAAGVATLLIYAAIDSRESVGEIMLNVVAAIIQN